MKPPIPSPSISKIKETTAPPLKMPMLIQQQSPGIGAMGVSKKK